MPALILEEKKTLKLTNVLIQKLIYLDSCNLDRILNQMQSFIRANGATQLGPLIQYIDSGVDNNGQTVIEMWLMIQCNTFIHKVYTPYTMERVLRIPNCMYCRYIGPDDKANYALDKIRLCAFEREIQLKQRSYTVFVNYDEENNITTTDVFVERVN